MSSIVGRSHSLSAFHPVLKLGRLASGVLAGVTGGIVVGPPLHALLRADAEALLGPMDGATFWSLHMIASLSIGLMFGAVIAPRSVASAARWGVGGAWALVWGGGELLVALDEGRVPVVGTGMLLDFAGHALFGLVMGASYVAFHRSMVRDAGPSRSLRWRRWAREETQHACLSP